MKRGFTLIELLVVIAIIAILAAILFPVFARAREKARQSSCLSNIKQMSLAAMMYTQDYDEVYPGGLTGASGEMGPISQSSSFTTFWITADVIYRYVNNKQVFLCPSRLGSNPIKHNYGFNSRLCPTCAPMLSSRCPGESSGRDLHVSTPAPTWLTERSGSTQFMVVCAGDLG